MDLSHPEEPEVGANTKALKSMKRQSLFEPNPLTVDPTVDRWVLDYYIHLSRNQDSRGAKSQGLLLASRIWKKTGKEFSAHSLRF